MKDGTKLETFRIYILYPETYVESINTRRMQTTDIFEVK